MKLKKREVIERRETYSELKKIDFILYWVVSVILNFHDDLMISIYLYFLSTLSIKNKLFL